MKLRPILKRLRWWLTATFAIGIAAAALLLADRIWIDYLWYKSLGQADVFAVRIGSQATVLVLAILLGMGVLVPTARAAWKIAGDRPEFRGLTCFACLLLATATAWNLSTQWMVFRLAVARAPFGVVDPQFGLDVGFFVFVLPALELLYSWLIGLIILAVVVALFIIFVSSRLDTSDGVSARWWQLKRLLSGLGGLLMLAVAFNFRLAIWQLVYSTRAGFAGASSADVVAQIPSLWILVGITVAVGMTLIATARRHSLRVAFIALGIWTIAAVALGGGWPAMLVQKFVVTPNEATAEAPYIDRNIAMTRSAFGLTSAITSEYPALESLTPSAAARTESELGNATVWTSSAVSQAFTQLQTIRPYYRLSETQYDRYRIDGKARQVLVAAREIDTSGLPAQAQTWVNTHLVYTHGYGLAMSATSKTASDGFPQFVLGDVPQRIASDVASSSPELDLSEPRLYFGTGTDDYAIVDTGIDEFDYPLGEKNVTYRYKSDGGIELGTWPRRLAWALRLNSDQVLFSDYLTPKSRVLLYRNVVQRASRLAPWLSYSTPYSTISDGRVVWIMDAHTASDHFPYSQPTGDGTNYLRGSVKVTVDALTGETTFYALGEDPVRDAWGKIFPTLITPGDKMPTTIASHLRPSKKLFSAQAGMFSTYHMTDPTVFYNKEDLWQLTRNSKGDPIGSAYVMLDLPNPTTGSTETAMYLLQPYSSPGRDNLVGWIAAASSPDAYGRLSAYLLPKDRVTLGPQQVTARINQDPTISQQLTLWNQPGSSLVFGDMLVLPVQGSVAYLQPLFLKAQSSAITQLASVIAVAGDEVEIDPNLEGALRKAYGSDSATGSANSGQ